MWTRGSRISASWNGATVKCAVISLRSDSIAATLSGCGMLTVSASSRPYWPSPKACSVAIWRRMATWLTRTAATEMRSCAVNREGTDVGVARIEIRRVRTRRGEARTSRDVRKARDHSKERRHAAGGELERARQQAVVHHGARRELADLDGDIAQALGPGVLWMSCCRSTMYIGKNEKPGRGRWMR